MAARKVVLLTANPDKRREYARTLGRYAVVPSFAPAPVGDAATDAEARRLVEGGADLVIRESADIFDPATRARHVLHDHLAPALNVSVAQAWTRGADGGVNVRRYSQEVEGFLDTASPRQGGGFGWDAVFRSAATGRTYAEDAALGLKTSARDLVFARIVADALHFERPVDLAFMPTGQERLVDFGRMPLDHLGAVSWFRTPAFMESPVSRLLAAAVEGGVFYRSALSRRERNYWLPGLNGGVPLVPKRDDIHELSFQFHDLMHAVMPDLLLTNGGDAATRRVYVLHRMVGEAISLVAADHAFVDTLERSGCGYDFGKRRIHPLFASLGADARTDEGLRTLARANMRFALLGDEEGFRELGADPAALSAYREKYARFFVEDYVWTERNHAAMAGEGAFAAKWSETVADAVSAAGIRTLDDFCEGVANRLDTYPSELDTIDLDRLADAVFDESWDVFLRPALAHPPGLDSVDGERARSNAFARWLIGQTVMYARYGHVPVVERVGGLVRDRLARRGEPFGAAEIERLRGLHDLAVDALARAQAISGEEARLFRDVVPVFDPSFAFYDAKGDGPRPGIRETAERLLPAADDAPAAGYGR